MKRIMLFVFLLLPSISGAQDQCVNDQRGTKNPQNKEIITNFRSSQDPLVLAFRTAATSLEKVECHLCGNQSSPTQLSLKGLDQIGNHLTPAKIKKECIVASLQREPGNEGITCSKGKPVSFSNRGRSTPCISQDLADYIHYSVNKAIECLSPADAPIDPRFILQKINNETAFNFFIGYSGGRGIGQLTSPPVKAISGWKTVKNKKTIDVEGEANFVLQDLAANTNPSCAPFQKIAEEDLKKPISLYGHGTNFCDWQGVGEGLTRNLIYSLGYYVHIRDNIVLSYLKKTAPKMAQNEEILNSFALVAYRSPVQAKALMKKLRVSNSSNPTQLVSQIRKYDAYSHQTASKMRELHAALGTTTKPSAEDLRGDSCVSH